MFCILSQEVFIEFAEVRLMTKAVIFDMYETLITLFESPVYFSTQMAEDTGITEEDFQNSWR